LISFRTGAANSQAVLGGMDQPERQARLLSERLVPNRMQRWECTRRLIELSPAPGPLTICRPYTVRELDGWGPKAEQIPVANISLRSQKPRA